MVAVVIVIITLIENKIVLCKVVFFDKVENYQKIHFAL